MDDTEVVAYFNKHTKGQKWRKVKEWIIRNGYGFVLWREGEFVGRSGYINLSSGPDSPPRNLHLDIDDEDRILEVTVEALGASN